jgi:FMN phosphatase YigB (HAD superfamily)
MFPAAVTAQRIAWAGLAADDFDHITTPENSHACKPNPAYFRSALDLIGVNPPEALFVGDDWELDMLPAMQVGLRTFWLLNRDVSARSTARLPDAAGAWEDFLAWWGDS